MARRSTQRIRTSEAGATFIEITWNHYPVFQEVYSLWTSEHMFDQVPGPKTKVFVTPCWCIIGAETKCSNNNIYGWFLILYPPVFVLKYLRLFIPSYILKPWKLTFKTLAEYHWTQIYVQRQCLCKRKIRIWKKHLAPSFGQLTWSDLDVQPRNPLDNHLCIHCTTGYSSYVSGWTNPCQEWFFTTYAQVFSTLGANPPLSLDKPISSIMGKILIFDA